MKSIIFRLFWRILLPFVLALVIAVMQMMEMDGRGGGGGHSSIFDRRLLLCIDLIFFCVLFGTALWNTLRWGKEAEEFESELKEAGETEKERRRRANWIVRE
jgi:hypothetical protein